MGIFGNLEQSGGLQAVRLNGERLWTKSHSATVHSAPVVGKIYGHGLAVVYGVGEPAGAAGSAPKYINGTFIAVDAKTGDTLWTFEPPVPWLLAQLGHCDLALLGLVWFWRHWIHNRATLPS